MSSLVLSLRAPDKAESSTLPFLFRALAFLGPRGQKPPAITLCHRVMPPYLVELLSAAGTGLSSSPPRPFMKRKDVCPPNPSGDRSLAETSRVYHLRFSSGDQRARLPPAMKLSRYPCCCLPCPSALPATFWFSGLPDETPSSPYHFRQDPEDGNFQ